MDGQSSIDSEEIRKKQEHKPTVVRPSTDRALSRAMPNWPTVLALRIKDGQRSRISLAPVHGRPQFDLKAQSLDRVPQLGVFPLELDPLACCATP
jgi:hypothetical protein